MYLHNALVKALQTTHCLYNGKYFECSERDCLL